MHRRTEQKATTSQGLRTPSQSEGSISHQVVSERTANESIHREEPRGRAASATAVRYGGPNRFDSWHFRTAPYEIRTNLSRNPPGTPRIRRHRPVAEEEGRKRDEGANSIIRPVRGQQLPAAHKHKETWGGLDGKEKR